MADEGSLRCRMLQKRLREIGSVMIGGAHTGGIDGFVRSKRLNYQEMIPQFRRAVNAALPEDATVAIVSKGDSALLKLGNRKAWHFPRGADGAYAGHYPATSAAAIEHLETLRADGADFLVFPNTAFWWLDFYKELHRHITSRYTQVLDHETCMVFRLTAASDRDRGGHNSTALIDERRQERQAPVDESKLRIELANTLSSSGCDDDACEVLAEGLRFDPDNAALLIHLAKCEGLRGNLEVAERYAAEALSKSPDDYTVNFETARIAWLREQLDAVEARLTQLVKLYPNDECALTELVNLLCTRLEEHSAASTRSIVSRLLNILEDGTRFRLISPETHLRIAETLGLSQTINSEPDALKAANRSIAHAISGLNISSEALRGFVSRLLRGVIDGALIPFDNPRELSGMLTHIGNGFALVGNMIAAHASYRVAVAADDGRWDSPAWAASFNLGFAAVSGSDVAEALFHFSKARRIFPEEALNIVWPAQSGARWPTQKFRLSRAFEKLKPASAEWPKITVITPSFNQAAYVEETLSSVLNQEYPNLEYIVVDGQSSDGSIEILESYRNRLTHLVIEPDEGQTDALNKGFRLSTGELLLWVNSDDMLAPGALFMLALAHLQSGADVVAGFCFEHTDHRIGLVNLPAATQATFNVDCMGDIFERWMRGDYFYQPEVAFSRRIFEKTGGALDQSLHYVMDYDLWLRCAAAGASLQVIHWPIAFFRKHAGQKTADLDRTVIEQGPVRDRYVQPRPNFARDLDIRVRLSAACSSSLTRVAVISTRAGKVFSQDAAEEMTEFGPEGFMLSFHDSLDRVRPGEYDVIIICVNIYNEQQPLRALRERGHHGPIIGWFWDNHHHTFANYALAKDLDVCMVSHAFAADYLRSGRYLLTDPLPACTTQWSAREATALFEQYGMGSRSNDLYGGFVRYEFSPKRNRLIEQLIDAKLPGVYFLNEAFLNPYFGMSPEDRFRTWASNKASVCIPVLGDLAQRFFDSLVTGQIPLVAPDVKDLDTFISPQLQQELPVLRFDKYTPEAVESALAEAIHRFDADGPEGALRRHRYAVEHHTFAVRIRQILSGLRQLATSGNLPD